VRLVLNKPGLENEAAGGGGFGGGGDTGTKLYT
jgi:hypothetical protein